MSSAHVKYCTHPKARAIVMALVDTALVNGLEISVNDGEETVVSKSTNRDEILCSMASTEYDRVSFHTPFSDGVDGRVWLIYGNGEDVISDYTDNEFTNSLVNAVMQEFE